MKILLCLICLSSIQDRPFLLIQETWIYNHTSRPSTLTDVMSTRLATLVRDLGCNHYSCRENATELLLQQTDEDMIRALYWGSHHTDRDIASRCRVTLNRSLVCNHCNGSGRCYRRSLTFSSDPGCRGCFNSMSSRNRISNDELAWFLRKMYYEQECICCLGIGHLWMEDFQ